MNIPIVQTGKPRPKDGSSLLRGLQLGRGGAGPDPEASLSTRPGHLPWDSGLTCIFGGPLEAGKETGWLGCPWCGAWPRAERSVVTDQGGVTGDTALPVPDSATQRAPPSLSRKAVSQAWEGGRSWRGGLWVSPGQSLATASDGSCA